MSLLWGLLLLGQLLTAQSFEFIETVKNQPVSFSFDNYSQISLNAPTISRQAENGDAAFNPHATNNPYKGIAIWGNMPTQNTIVYTPDADFIGTDYFIVNYRASSPGSTMKKVVAVTVHPTSVKAVNDYAMVTAGQTVTIDVLANDHSDSTTLSVYRIPHINNGSVQLVNNDTEVAFTPAPGFSGVANFNYSICDTNNDCDAATVSICVLDATATTLDPVSIFTKKNVAQVILTPLEGFIMNNQPTNGNVQFTSDNVWLYTPNTDFVGLDDIIFTNPTTNQQQVVSMQVLDAPTPNVFLRPDVAHTRIGGEVIVDALANDIGGTALSAIGLVGGNPITTANGGTVFFNSFTNEFTYIAEPNFEGTDEFQYRARPPQFAGPHEYETVSVVVSDQKPSQTLFQLTTPESTPLVIAYNVPIEDYTYANINQVALSNGTVAYYAGQQTITINNELVSGYNMLVYSPNATATAGATDSFEFDYCVGTGNTNCQLVKVDIEIVQVNTNSDPECSGRTCVWPGDTNTDGVVDIRDLLPIGLCMGEVGLQRAGAAADWYPQFAEDWNLPGLPNVNVKHIDVDGDGVVSAVDTTAIGNYYGMHSGLTPAVNSLNSDARLYLENWLPTQSISAGDVILLDLYYGDAANPIIDAYGLTFELQYDLGIFEQVAIHYEPNSWMSYDSPILTMNQEPFAGKIHSGYTRTSGYAASGMGKIGVVEFIVIDDLPSLRYSGTEFNVNLNPLGGLTSTGQSTTASGNTITFELNIDETEEEVNGIVTEAQVKVYPNPARDLLTVHLNGQGNEVEQVTVYGITGQEVYNSGTINTKRLQLDVSQYVNGMYMVEVVTNGGTFIKKIEIIE